MTKMGAPRLYSDSERRERHNQRQRERYARLSTSEKASRSAAEVERRREKRRYVFDHLKANPCVDCGETDPIVLEFDHRDPAEKLFALSKAARRTLAAIRDEIAKCDVRCANCHRRRTAVQQGWYDDHQDET